MYLTPHAVLGGIIGERAQNPLIAFVLGFLSHFILDAIPHGDEDIGALKQMKGEKYYIRLMISLVFFDTLLALILFIILSRFGYIENSTSALSGAIGAMLPDYLWGVNVFFKNKFLAYKERLHSWIHNPLRIAMPVWAGIVWQIIFIALCIKLFVL